MKKTKIVFCFIILPFLFGCVTSGPQRADDIGGVDHEMAILKVPANIDIVVFDGERIEIDYMPMYGQSTFKMMAGKSKRERAGRVLKVVGNAEIGNNIFLLTCPFAFCRIVFHEK